MISPQFNNDDIRLYSYYSSQNMMNSYVVWHKNRQEALLVDPVILDSGLFEVIESNHLEIVAILITHADEERLQAVKTLPKIYHSIRIYGGASQIFSMDMENLRDIPRFIAAGFSIYPLYLPGNHSDSLMYKIGDILFTGDLLEAGRLAFSDGGYARKLLCEYIRETLFTLNENSLVLPIHGPPSTIGVERETNPHLVDLC